MQSKDPPDIYDNYLTHYFSKGTNQAQIHQRKLAYLGVNYEQLLPESKDAVICEIGPGHGELLEWLVARGYNAVRAIDLSEEVVIHCNNLFPGSTELVKNTGAFMNERSSAFDLIFMMHVLEHVPKQETIPLLKSIHSALKANGSLLVEVPNMGNPVTGLYTRYADFTHEVGFTAESLEFVLRTAGFSQVTLHEVQLPRDKWYRPIQRVCYKALMAGYRMSQFIAAQRASPLTSHAIFARAVK